MGFYSWGSRLSLMYTLALHECRGTLLALVLVRCVSPGPVRNLLSIRGPSGHREGWVGVYLLSLGISCPVISSYFLIGNELPEILPPPGIGAWVMGHVCHCMAPTGDIGQNLQGNNGGAQRYCLYLLKPKEGDCISLGPAFANTQPSRTQTLTTKCQAILKSSKLM